MSGMPGTRLRPRRCGPYWSAPGARQAVVVCGGGLSRAPGGSRPGHLPVTAAAGCHAVPLASFLRVRLHAVAGAAARLCQPCTVKPALSEAGVPICTW
jgi:hypothetical protein